MSNIYIIAGPPGIGKSTLGYRFIPSDLISPKNPIPKIRKIQQTA